MFAARIARAIQNLKTVDDSDYSIAVHAAGELLFSAFSNGNKLLVFGNGGSAADAQHICCELTGRFSFDRKPLSAIALTADSAFLTAWTNDCGYDEIFARQIEAHGRAGDVTWGISTSGNSKNVVVGLKKAKEMGLKTIGLTGQGGGAAAEYCDVLLAVPLAQTPEIQEIHMLTYHVLCGELEQRMFGARV